MTIAAHNPFRELRLRQGISQYDLANRIKISKHAVLRLEQGCYEKPLPSVVEYFTNHYPDISSFSLIRQYEEFQYETRRSNAGLLGDLSTLKDCPVGDHPLTWIRTAHGYNPTSLAKALCISQSTVVYFERRAVHQHTVPNQLLRALHDADYSEQETDYLVEAYFRYRRWLNSNKELTLV